MDHNAYHGVISWTQLKYTNEERRKQLTLILLQEHKKFTYVFKLVLWDSFYSCIEVKVFSYCKNFEKSIKLRTITNLTFKE